MLFGTQDRKLPRGEISEKSPLELLGEYPGHQLPGTRFYLFPDRIDQPIQVEAPQNPRVPSTRCGSARPRYNLLTTALSR